MLFFLAINLVGASLAVIILGWAMVAGNIVQAARNRAALLK